MQQCSNCNRNTPVVGVNLGLDGMVLLGHRTDLVSSATELVLQRNTTLCSIICISFDYSFSVAWT